MIRRAWLLFATMASMASAQGLPPSDIDLKAAYCFGRVRDVSPIATDGVTGDLLDSLSATNRRVASAKLRLRAYVEPRAQIVEPTAILAAIKAGVTDQAAYLAAAKDCFQKMQSAPSRGESFSIGRSCSIEAGWPKLKECEDAAFLPF